MILKLYLKRLYLSALIAGGMIIASSNITYASEVPNQEPAYTKTADNEEPSADNETEKEKSVRTIMLYDCGGDLETKGGMATYNLRQILNSNFSKDDKIKLIVMTGGSDKWHLESEYLYDPETGSSPETIDNQYNQIWEAKGLDASENPGQLVLIDKDGILGDGENAKKADGYYVYDELWERDRYIANDLEWMTDPVVLKEFINYCVENYPADKYDLILWDHGGGILGGFGYDDHDRIGNKVVGQTISYSDFIDVIADCAVVKNGGKFDFIDFDACLMNSIEFCLGITDYADYYIASADSSPAFGQYYTGWLDAIGAEPDKDTYELGKIIVDDYKSFYESEDSDGSGRKATLGIVALQPFADSGIIEALTELTEKLRDQVTRINEDGDILFYDEYNSFYNTLRYAHMDYSDLGNLAALISVVQREIKPEDITGDLSVFDNEYLECAQRIAEILRSPEYIYQAGTENESTNALFFRKPDGTIDIGPLYTSGMQIFFPSVDSPIMVEVYEDKLEPVLSKMPEGEPMAAFFRDYVSVLHLYAAIPVLGRTIDELVDNGCAVEDINYDTVKEQLFDPDFPDYNDWSDYILPALTQNFGSEEAGRSWVSAIIEQQAREVVRKSNIALKTVNNPEGKGYRVQIDNTKQRAIDSVRTNVLLELPAFADYIEQNPSIERDLAAMGDDYLVRMGTIVGTPDFDFSFLDGELIEYAARKMNGDSCTWNLDPVEEKWYAVEDQDGNLHVAAAEENGNDISVITTYDLNGETAIAELIFRNDKLSEICFRNKENGRRTIKAADLQENLNLTTVCSASLLGEEYCFPISRTDFALTPENIDSISLVYTDISDISDIGDINGDGKAYTEQIVVKDIYSYEWDITDMINNPAGEMTSIRLADVLPVVYNGQEQVPQVYTDSGILTEGKEYTWEKGNEEEIFRDAGTYEVLLTGVGDYLDVTLGFFIIQPAPIEETVISGIVDKTYTGKAVSQSPVVKLGEITLEEGKDYTVSYKNNIEIGTAFMTITGVGNITGEITKSFRISAKTDKPSVTPKSEQNTPSIPSKDGSKKPIVSQKPALTKVTSVIRNASGEQVTGIPDRTTQNRSEKSVQDSTAKPASAGVKTGDDSPVSLWIFLMLFSVGVISSAIRSRRKNQG